MRRAGTKYSCTSARAWFGASGDFLSFDEDCRGKRACVFALTAEPRRGASVGVDFGCAWLTLEHVRVLGPRADADAAVAASACTRAPRRWCSCASLGGF